VPDTTVPFTASVLPVQSLRVEVVKGVDKGKNITAGSDTITVGTAPGNDLVLTDDTVSRYHLDLRHLGSRILVVDHGSTNGTIVGPVAVERATVSAGTLLMLGKTGIKIEDGETFDMEVLQVDRLGDMRGRSPAMRKLMAQIAKVAQTDASVLLIGETGAGKEVVARAVHQASPRASRPFETVDCGALSPMLVASELFGHEKGSFTGADQQHVGAFERANGGTLFLDEIGELPSALQASLLGALERRQFRRVGGQSPIAVDVRVVCATNRDLRREVNKGTFRQDLYFRIAVVLLRIPSLRDRPDDIPLLVEHFLREAGHNGAVEEIVPREAMEALGTHRWPGNVRELRNFVEAALAMGEPPHLDAMADEPSEGVRPSAPREGQGDGFPSVPFARLYEMTYKDARALVVEEFEAKYLKALLERSRHNVSKAARESDIHRSYLTQMLKRHGLR
jgi:DNA-binding NtrC family response regulator